MKTSSEADCDPAVYMATLADDVSRLGLGPAKAYVANWGNFWNVLIRTSKLGWPDHIAAAKKNPPVYTELGQLMLDYGQSSTPLKFIHGSQVCCSAAEERLVDDLRADKIGNREILSPVLLTRKGVLKAIMKGYGERSVYGLRDDPAHGIVAGAFSEPPKGLQERMTFADVPFYLELETSMRSMPLRLSGFLLPQGIRQQTAAPCRLKPPLETPADIIARADELLACAEPLPDATEATTSHWQNYEQARIELFS